MLQKRPEDLQRVRNELHRSRVASATEFENRVKSSIKNFGFYPGMLVLVRNSKLDSMIGHKTKPRYIGPMVVVRRTTGGSYILAELDGAISRLRFAEYRLAPYRPRDILRVPVTRITGVGI
ncbi:hypothetical protein FA15DRAFT_606068 [Coprinopsis marcescibilis]|uniref:Uncharacterized protein n=1 Tax=Coprinopsis marcescibilis TaxID=230819 RepID=A0A5C3KA26_COPMA|nr:hypothetical protein FA15DRAFT_606068 [Coprinopsis marcescibilis]